MHWYVLLLVVASWFGGRAAVGQSIAPPSVGGPEEWPVRVLDLATGQGVPNVVVDGRTSRVQAVTDADGWALLMVGSKPESIVVHGAAGYGYHVGEYDHTAPKFVYLVPDAMYHKTPLIPVSGTVAPVVFQGTTQTVLGPNPYTIEVEVPQGVLPRAASLWIAPVPSFASPCPPGFDSYVNASVGQFAVELRDAQGKQIVDVLPSPGVIVRCSPTWYPYSMVPTYTDIVKGGQCRLTKTSARWDHQPDEMSWDPASGMFTAHLRACSWWIWILPFFMTRDSYNPPPPPVAVPPSPEVSIARSDCVKSQSLQSLPVNCGVVTGGPATVNFGTNGQVNINGQIVAALQASLGISPTQLAAVLTRLNAQFGAQVSGTAGGGVTIAVSGQAAQTINANQSLGASLACFSGDWRLAIAARPFTLTYGTNTYTWDLPEGIISAQCLTRDTGCGEPCWNVHPTAHQKYYPPSYKVCAGDPLKCW
jgi:hypothetical protein